MMMDAFDKISNYIEELEQGGRQARIRVVELVDKVNELKEENKKLNEFKNKREESKFYFRAQMERAEPKTAREAEDLQRAKEIFEKLYREELSCLEEENKILREVIREATEDDKKAERIFMEEDTLQELRDLGEI